MTSKGFGDSVKWLYLSADLPVERNAVSSCDTKAMKKFSWLIQPTIEVILLRAISSPFTSVMEGYGNKHTMGSGLKNTLVTKTSDVVKILQCIEIFIKVRTDYNSWRLEGRKKKGKKVQKREKKENWCPTNSALFWICRRGGRGGIAGSDLRSTSSASR